MAANKHMSAAEELNSADGKKLLATLKAIDEMPESVAEQGDAAVQAYLESHPTGAKPRIDWSQTAKCAASITAAIASGLVPAAKILKLKAFIGKAGSVREAAFLLIRISKGEEKLNELGPVLGSLASEVLGIDGIKKNCT
ncbi:hypothetical protein [Streptomyces melanogenes]|uniref:hypothetical protein n=1 Tax=Streptomyces melanogenes TaxID=67326 RepID=UPI003790F33E